MPSPGEIWLAEIPFTDGSASKIRPVLVLWLDVGDAVVSAVAKLFKNIRCNCMNSSDGFLWARLVETAEVVQPVSS